MGFDLSIEMVMQMCPEKGKPYYMVYDEDTKALEKVYGIPDVQVPEHLAKYLQGRGRHLEVYLKDLNDDGPEYPYVLLDFYPTFEEVKEWSDYEDYWTEGDHEHFRELLEWCAEQKVSFQVSWSF
jgi:hypothetical protein